MPAGTAAADAGLLVGVGAAVAAGNVVSVRALKLGDVSHVAPLNELVPVFVVPVELLLTASVGSVQVVGVALAVAAVYVANYETASVVEPFRRPATYRPARLALGGALLFALGTWVPGRCSQRRRSRRRRSRCSGSSRSRGWRCRSP